MNVSSDILYLSAADVMACALEPQEINAAVEAAFLAVAQGEAVTRPALSMPAGARASFRAKGGVLGAAGYAAVKWYGYFPGNTQHGRAEYSPLILLSDAETGFPLAIMEGTWITAVRTAAITAIGAKWLAHPDAQRVAFVGCGTQARASLEALLPNSGLSSAVACGRRRETAEAFAVFARRHGIETEVTDDPHHAIADADIVVTSVPRQSPRTHFLDAGGLSPNAFVSMVDYGVSFRTETLDAFSRCFADDAEQASIRAEQGDTVVPYAGSLAEIVGGAKSGRGMADERLALVVSGTGLADVAAAAAVYGRARALDLGQSLSLCGEAEPELGGKFARTM